MHNRKEHLSLQRDKKILKECYKKKVRQIKTAENRTTKDNNISKEYL